MALVNPLISIIIPIYQVEQYIEASIKSVINQSYTNIEIILVNDGSKDKSIDLALSVLRTKQKPFRLINQQNRGPAASRNIGIKNSHGEWVICIDPDDIVAPDLLDRLYRATQKYGVDAACSNFQSQDPGFVFENHNYPTEDTFFKQEDILLNFLKRKVTIIAPSILIKMETIVIKQLWYNENIRYSEDLDYIWRMLFAVKSLVYVNDKLYYYTRRPNSTMFSSNIEKILTGYAGIKSFCGENIGIWELKDFILPRWVLGALKASTIMMNYESFSQLAKKMNYKKYAFELFNFPDMRVILMAVIIKLDLKIFYLICRIINNELLLKSKKLKNENSPH